MSQRKQRRPSERGNRAWESPKETAASIAQCLDYLHSEALMYGLAELSHFIGVAAEVARNVAELRPNGEETDDQLSCSRH